MCIKKLKWKKNWRHCQLASLLSLSVLLISCSHLPQKNSLGSHDYQQAFKARWSFFSHSEKKEASFRAIVIQKDQNLRVDILKPLIHRPYLNIILKKEVLLLRFPSKKKYYQGAFNSRVFFPNFDSIESSLLLSLFQASTKKFQNKAWKCTNKSEIIECHKGALRISWIFHKQQLKKIKMKSSKAGSLEIDKIQHLTYPLSKPPFLVPLEGYRKQNEIDFKTSL